MSPATICKDTSWKIDCLRKDRFLNKPDVVTSEVAVFLDLVEVTLVVATEDVHVTVVIISERRFLVL